MNLKRILRPVPHLERDPAQQLLLVGIGGALAAGAAVGTAWAAGFARVLEELGRFDPVWLPVAFGLEVQGKSKAERHARAGDEPPGRATRRAW